MTTLMENPIPIVVIGVILCAFLAIVWVNTRRGSILLLMLGVGALVLGGVALERYVITEKEEVELTLDDLTAALETNDLARIYQFVTPSAQKTRTRAAWALGMVRITDTSINNLEIELNRLTSPPTAEARFDGVIYYDGLKEVITSGRYPAKFTMTFERHGDRWLVSDHIEHSAQRP